MNALILAAGEGQRLRPLTERSAKPMLKIGGSPILSYNVRMLVRAGIKRIVINVHHQPEEIIKYFGDGNEFGCEIFYSPEPSLLGTAGALKQAKKIVGGFDATFAVIYGDNLTDMRFENLLAKHSQEQAACTLALFHREDVSASGIVEIDNDDRLIRFLEKPMSYEVFSHWVNAGLMVLEPVAFDYIGAVPCDFGRNVLPAMLASNEPLFGYRMSEQLWWIDSLEDYHRTVREFASAAAHLKTEG